MSYMQRFSRISSAIINYNSFICYGWNIAKLILMSHVIKICAKKIL